MRCAPRGLPDHLGKRGTAIAEKKKIGIATMTGGTNYGNCLQNYAVQTTLEKLGYEAFTLNNTTKRGFQTPAAPDLPLTKKLVPSYVMRYLHTRQGYRCGSKNDRDFFGKGYSAAKKQIAQWQEAVNLRQERFDAFRTRMISQDAVPMDCNRWDKDHLEEYFAFVCGSDQVWNPYYHTTSCIDFLQFAPAYKRVCFAPSFGISEIPEARRAIYAEWLGAIPHLSVREEAGAKIIEELTGRRAEVLMDPTFCLTREEWRVFSREPAGADVLASKPEGPFVLCYFLGNMNARYERKIRAYAERSGCKIVYLWDIQALEHYAIDPQEFVWLIDHAQAVFTDSFHGAAFSINLEKPFVVFPRDEGGKSMGSRLDTLLETTGLEKSKWQGFGGMRKLDFRKSSKIIEAERERTRSYLSNALQATSNQR